PAAYIQMLLSSNSIRDFVNRLSFVRKVVNDHQARIVRLRKLSDQLAAARFEAESHKTDIEARKAAVEAERTKIGQLKIEVAAAKQEVVAELQKRKALLSKVEAEKAEYMRQMQRLEQESKNIASLLKSRQAGQVYSGGGRNLAWPTTGQVTSSFGWRTHPIFGDKRFHAGIDIGAPAGQSVVAADSGEVIFAGYKGGYGLVVVIDHGGAFGTVYAHLSKASVITGSDVSRGGKIGNVGCTGYCTGPHLHYETRIKGEPVDPMQYY
ncbi:MAG: murein hydrolase activator EnvC family protein, partial [Acidimicrobiia bacterium]